MKRLTHTQSELGTERQSGRQAQTDRKSKCECLVREKRDINSYRNTNTLS